MLLLQAWNLKKKYENGSIYGKFKMLNTGLADKQMILIIVETKLVVWETNWEMN